ncbi:hypothetical protein FM106_27115 [Brachybacterium faecium]|nr:hypothetical protein FM106_27115 [Brachybacterium faecium]
MKSHKFWLFLLEIKNKSKNKRSTTKKFEKIKAKPNVQ